jgi:hypothetical protein
MEVYWAACVAVVNQALEIMSGAAALPNSHL